MLSRLPGPHLSFIFSPWQAIAFPLPWKENKYFLGLMFVLNNWKKNRFGTQEESSRGETPGFWNRKEQCKSFDFVAAFIPSSGRFFHVPFSHTYSFLVPHRLSFHPPSLHISTHLSSAPFGSLPRQFKYGAEQKETVLTVMQLRRENVAICKGILKNGNSAYSVKKNTACRRVVNFLPVPMVDWSLCQSSSTSL